MISTINTILVQSTSNRLIYTRYLVERTRYTAVVLIVVYSYILVHTWYELLHTGRPGGSSG